MLEKEIIKSNLEKILKFESLKLIKIAKENGISFGYADIHMDWPNSIPFPGNSTPGNAKEITTKFYISSAVTMRNNRKNIINQIYNVILNLLPEGRLSDVELHIFLRLGSGPDFE